MEAMSQEGYGKCHKKGTGNATRRVEEMSQRVEEMSQGGWRDDYTARVEAV